VAGECRWNPGAHPDNYRFTADDAVLEDLIGYRAAGGRTVVDATPLDLGRSPAVLRRQAQDSGLHVVMGTGYYLEASHRPHVPSGGEEEATYDLVVREHRDGIDGARPGIIGEIGTSDPPTQAELRVLRGAARAAVETGLPLTVHLHPWGHNGEPVIEVVCDAGLAPTRLLLNHLTTAVDDARYLDRLLQTGVGLAFDLFGFDHSLLQTGRYPPTDHDVARTVARLIAAGHGRQLFLSQDVGVRTRLTRYGGWGYAHLLDHVVPMLLTLGPTTQDVETMLVRNTSELLTLRPAA
jgi:phosphotriesterase-related protein